MSDFSQADQTTGLPHPNNTEQVFGHDAPSAQVLEAINGDRVHHAWMLTGPKGIGKATLAYKIARFLLVQDLPGESLLGTQPPVTSLAVSPDHPISSRIRARSEPGLYVLRRQIDEKTGKGD